LDVGHAHRDGYQEGYLVEVAEESINAWRPVVLHAVLISIPGNLNEIFWGAVVSATISLTKAKSDHEMDF